MAPKVNIPIGPECSITTASWSKISARILLFFFPSECSLPSGATRSQSDGRLGVNCEPGVMQSFLPVYLHYSNPERSCGGINEAHQERSGRRAARGDGRARSLNGRSVSLTFIWIIFKDKKNDVQNIQALQRLS